jgi:hypothetical protein
MSSTQKRAEQEKRDLNMRREGDLIGWGDSWDDMFATKPQIQVTTTGISKNGTCETGCYTKYNKWDLMCYKQRISKLRLCKTL